MTTAVHAAPGILMRQGQLINHWRDARLFGLLAATLCWVWRRDMLGTILAGTAVMLLLRLTLGW